MNTIEPMPSQSFISSASPQKPQRPKWSRIVIVVVLVFIFIGGISVGYWVRTFPHNFFSIFRYQPVSKVDVNLKQNISTSTAVQVYPSPEFTTCKTYVPTTRQLSGQIDWIPAVSIDNLDIFSTSTLEGRSAVNYSKDNSKFYKVGTVRQGNYAGYDVILADIAVEEPGFYPNYYRFLRWQSRLVMLGKYSPKLNEYDELDHSKFTVDNNYYISDLDYPESFQGSSNRQNFILDPYATFSFCADDLVKLFHHPNLGDVYTSSQDAVSDGTGISKNFHSHGFYLEAPDGTTKVYKFTIDFEGPDNVPAVTWNDGAQNTAEYTFTDIGGCGSTNYLSVISPNKVNPSADLTEAGVNSFNEKVFTLKNPEHQLLKDIYNNQYYVYQGEKMSYNDFVKNRPVFFWYDPFGRLIKFQNNKFVPPTECGKPVIYLYPQQTIKVSVKLSPVGGFSYTKPAYNGGWNIIAYPSGALLNPADSRIYPYLFWEGRGGLYPGNSEKGFVVARENVHDFLVEKLRLLGLNAQESSDFIEFWEPKMQNAPYYFVTFYGNAVMDALAPLVVSPAPDTIIRVLMDFQPLKAPVPVQTYEIKNPVRRGFTLVEWGGVLKDH